jgi:hypothetical protein
MKFHMNTEPPTPTLLSPANNSVDMPAGIQSVSWSTVTDAEGSPITYSWIASIVEDFSTLLFGGTTSSTTIGFSIQPGKTYYWRVRAFDGYEFGSNSTTFNFKTVMNGTISGRVTDVSGDPLQGASVSIFGTSFSNLTDANGDYSISHIPPGSYFIDASLDGYATSTLSVQIAPAQDTVANFTLPPAISSISGKVVDIGGSPIEGATVKLYDGDGNIIDSASTNSTGEFTFQDLDFGNYTLQVSKEGYQDASKLVALMSTDPVVLMPIELSPVDECGEGGCTELPWWLFAILAVVIVVLLLVVLLKRRRPPEAGREEKEEVVPDDQEEVIPAEHEDGFQTEEIEEPGEESAGTEEIPEKDE